jgi:hypothetical protein
VPELPSGLVLLPAQRAAPDDAGPAGPAVAAAVHDGTRAAVDAEAAIADSSPWFDWRRARGFFREPEPEPASASPPEPGPAAPPEMPADVPGGATSGPDPEAEESPGASPWFRSTGL